MNDERNKLISAFVLIVMGLIFWMAWVILAFVMRMLGV